MSEPVYSVSAFEDGNHAFLMGSIFMSVHLGLRDDGITSRVLIETVDENYTNRIHIQRPSGNYTLTLTKDAVHTPQEETQ